MTLRYTASILISSAAVLLLGAACSTSSSSATQDAPPAVAAGQSRLATDDTLYLTRLGLIRGHLHVGIALYRSGMLDHARGHMKHPGDELYAELNGAFSQRGSPGFADELDALAHSVEQGAGAAAVDAAYARLLEAITAAEARVAPVPDANEERNRAVAANLLREAAREYGIGVVDGRIEQVHEYQDAYGFTHIAIDYLRRAPTQAGAPGSKRPSDVDDVEALLDLWPALVPGAHVDGDAGRIVAVAGEIGTR